ncbi:similar to RIKEN cDNA 1700012B09 (predicted), isoform CRA_a [Rattus norvegicus]|nr:uncharacterized protein C11orf97 homolog [Rattus norvegicus]EDL78466.1 similar to RIKEN cDNA 1700012B09 (predicted), isoform CRA_a [Rattus norvegicus]EDL78467.1 similar to RIKEN cDNA 1700012B09 (predicted), isoform CRA_a [Rattus norvegicus]|eukprot:NP_001102759.1 uncharacterized protein C11orf97 homolog [Rattus norvegicus]
MPCVPEQPVAELRGLVAVGRGDPGGMRRQEALVVTAGTASEASRDGEQPRPAGLVCRARVEPGGPQESRQQWKTFLYCEPHKRIKEVLEEELSIKRDECHVKSPTAVALDGIWSIRRNLPVGGMIPGQQSRNCSLPQTKYYSRHGGLRR